MNTKYIYVSKKLSEFTAVELAVVVGMMAIIGTVTTFISKKFSLNKEEASEVKRELVETAKEEQLPANASSKAKLLSKANAIAARIKSKRN